MRRYVLMTVAACVSATLAFGTLSAKADVDVNKTAVAGIIAATQGTVNQKTNIGNKASLVTAGISLAFDKYYKNDASDILSVKGIESILKLTPNTVEENQTTVTEEVASEQPVVEDVVIDGYTNLGVANVENYLNVREEASLEGSVLGKLPMNAGCEILETLDGWYKISSGDVSGYVSAEFLLTGAEANERAKEALSLVATVNADKLMVREQPNTECTILNRVAENEDLEVAAQLDGWVQVNFAGTTGYVSADYVTVHNALPKGVTLEQLSEENGNSEESINVVEYAKQFLGNPYVWGGTSLTNGCDCSGFTMRIYEHFGYSLSRTSGAQSNDGTRVSLDEIQPGDLLFYSYGGSIGHVAMYIGGGQIIHASTEKTGICIGNAFFMTPTCATRIAG